MLEEKLARCEDDVRQWKEQASKAQFELQAASITTQQLRQQLQFAQEVACTTGVRTSGLLTVPLSLPRAVLSADRVTSEAWSAVSLATMTAVGSALADACPCCRVPSQSSASESRSNDELRESLRQYTSKYAVIVGKVETLEVDLADLRHRLSAANSKADDERSAREVVTAELESERLRCQRVSHFVKRYHY